MKVNSAKEYRAQIKYNKYRLDVEEDFMGYSYGSKRVCQNSFFENMNL